MAKQWRKKRLAVLAAALGMAMGLAVPGQAQENKDYPWFQGFERLGANATNSSEVTLDKDAVDMGARKLRSEGGESPVPKKLRGLYVRSYEFDKAGKYDRAEFHAFAEKFRGPEWRRTITSRDNKDETVICVHIVNGEPVGQLILTAEEKEVSLVYMDGATSLGDLNGVRSTPPVPPVPPTPPVPAAPPTPIGEKKKPGLKGKSLLQYETGGAMPAGRERWSAVAASAQEEDGEQPEVMAVGWSSGPGPR